MLTAIQIMYVFIAFQGESNSTSIALNQPYLLNDLLNDYAWVFSLIAAGGSIATAAGFFVLRRQSRLTRVQISQTQQEIDATLRPWMAHTSCHLIINALDDNHQHVDAAKLTLKNYGRLPARITGQVQLWKLTEIQERDLTNQLESTSTHVMYFPDQERPYDLGAQPHIKDANLYYFAFLIRYDFQGGTGRKEGKYGAILKYELTDLGTETSVLNTFAG